MIQLVSRLIMANDTSRDLESKEYETAAEAERKIEEIIGGNVGKEHQLMHTIDPDTLIIAAADNPDGDVTYWIFTGPAEVMHGLQVFALRYKVQTKRKDNISRN